LKPLPSMCDLVGIGVADVGEQVESLTNYKFSFEFSTLVVLVPSTPLMLTMAPSCGDTHQMLATLVWSLCLRSHQMAL